MNDPDKTNADYWTSERLAEIEDSWLKRPSVNRQESEIRSLVAALRFSRRERDEQSDRADDNFASVERIKVKYSTLMTAARHMLDKINSQGFWDDGCFYYQRRSAPELQNPIEALTKALNLESVSEGINGAIDNWAQWTDEYKQQHLIGLQTVAMDAHKNAKGEKL